MKAQEWLDTHPEYGNEEQKKTIKRLDLSNLDLEGDLDLTDFLSLSEINIINNFHSNKLNILGKENDSTERIRKIMSQQIADLEVAKKALSCDLENRCEKITELEISLDETREQYNNVLRNSNNRAQQKRAAFLERNLEQLTNLQKQYVEQNSSLKKEVAIAEQKLFARNERIQALEALLQDAQEKLTSQDQKFEAQLQAVRERLEQARIQKSTSGIGGFGRIAKPLRGGVPVHERERELTSSIGGFGRIAKPLRGAVPVSLESQSKQENEKLISEREKELVELKKQLNEVNEHVNLAHQDIEGLREVEKQKTVALSWDIVDINDVKKVSSEFLKEQCSNLQHQELEQQSQQFQYLFELLFPNKSYNFAEFKQETVRLKHQELAPQIRKEREELEKLTNIAKSKLSKAEIYPFEKLLKKHNKVLKTNNNSDIEKLNELKESLNEKLTEKEIKAILDKQTELWQLEKHLENLKQNQQQVAQIQQVNEATTNV